jgi:UDP-N-acetylmuramate dehydrogenase
MRIGKYLRISFWADFLVREASVLADYRPACIRFAGESSIFLFTSMITFASHYSLRHHNTFGADVSAERWASLASVGQLQEAVEAAKGMPKLVLGGGSNILFTRPVEAWVLHNAISGWEVLRETADRVWLQVGGGTSWHGLVLHAVAQGWGGLENLSLIPGTVGAAPIQNIGAYGAELQDVFEWLEAYELETGRVVRFSREECRFGYRNSFFKQEGRGRFFIASVALSLTKRGHTLRTEYGAIAQTLEAMGVSRPQPADISRAVMSIRQEKLPDPAVIGNCGSFFQNPEIPAEQFEALRAQHPGMPHYPTSPGWVKVPAGWLIEQCGWKGKRVGRVGAYEKQALVLVNYGGATGQEAWALALEIQESVQRRFGIRISPEVNIY